MWQYSRAMFWQNQSACTKGSSRSWHLRPGILIFSHWWKIWCYSFFQKTGGELQSLVLWCMKKKAWVPHGPGPVRTEMVMVEIGIGVKVGERNCWEMVEGLVWEAGGSGWACMRATFCVKWMTCWVKFPMFAINVWITVIVSANWFSKFDDMEVVPDSWDMSGWPRCSPSASDSMLCMWV